MICVHSLEFCSVDLQGCSDKAHLTRACDGGGVRELIYSTREEMKLQHRCRGQAAGRQIRGKMDAKKKKKNADWKHVELTNTSFQKRFSAGEDFHSEDYR